ncbi:hypothetical protein SAMN05660748_2302 [Blastococcus aggregatus]|uniref:Uncharacterized protein n=1 Tax=Blastococcus aggregatus TaxID=38502 RepID=A0A285V621_9ACTN|nr:hypothetical protein [Blastococcus aggregatus]SOC49574.1 hypothetical protein SAMN05660748_2302 [Blastococcus aggregatus]
MSTEDRAPGTSDAGRRRVAAEPLQMTEAEKAIAEWEARHDVASRGHRAAPDLVQHYLAHERLEHPASPKRDAARAASSPQPAQPVAQPEPGARDSRFRGLLGKLFRRG